MRNNGHWIWMGLKFALFIVAAGLVVGFTVMTLWNWLFPSLFGWGIITFWQAIGLLVLARILFGGLRRRKSHHWKSRMWHRYQNMSPDEQANFKCGARYWKSHWEKVPETDTAETAS